MNFRSLSLRRTVCSSHTSLLYAFAAATIDTSAAFRIMLNRVNKQTLATAMVARPGVTNSETFVNNNKAMVDAEVAAAEAVVAVVAAVEEMVEVVEATVQEIRNQVMVRFTSKRKYRR